MSDKQNNTKQAGDCCEECIHDNPSADRVCLTCPCHKKNTEQVSGSLREELEEICKWGTPPKENADNILSLLKQNLEGVVGEEKKSLLNLPISFAVATGYNQKREEILQKVKELLN